MPHRCFHCHKSLPTSQGLNGHITQRPICHAAYEQLLTHLHIQRYDPEDPDQHPRDDEPQQTDVLLSSSESQVLPDSLPDIITRAAASMGASDMDDMPIPTDVQELNIGTPDSGDTTTTQSFPRPAGMIYGWGPTHFQTLQCALDETGCQPFIDEKEWQLAEMSMTNGMSQHELDKLLKLPIVRGCY